MLLLHEIRNKKQLYGENFDHIEKYDVQYLEKWHRNGFEMIMMTLLAINEKRKFMIVNDGITENLIVFS